MSLLSRCIIQPLVGTPVLIGICVTCNFTEVSSMAIYFIMKFGVLDGKRCILLSGEANRLSRNDFPTSEVKREIGGTMKRAVQGDTTTCYLCLPQVGA